MRCGNGWLVSPVSSPNWRGRSLADITRLTEDINALEKRITDTVHEVAPRLFGMPGCGALTAAKIMGETALVTRFFSEAAFRAACRSGAGSAVVGKHRRADAPTEIR